MEIFKEKEKKGIEKLVVVYMRRYRRPLDYHYSLKSYILTKLCTSWMKITFPVIRKYTYATLMVFHFQP